MSAPVLLITGTDTDVGKTVATAAISAALMSQGLRVAVVKPAQTGLQPGEPGDADEVARLLGVSGSGSEQASSNSANDSRGTLETHEFVRLPDPLAPDAAARRAGMALPSIDAHADRILEIAGRDDIDTVLVEGSGGLLVRLDDDGRTLADLGSALNQRGIRAGFVLVTTARLGTLNATALTAEALRARDLDLVGFLVGSYPADPGLAEQTNLDDLPVAAGAQPLGLLPEGSASLPPAQFCENATEWVQL